jgi:hypothetical protein
MSDGDTAIGIDVNPRQFAQNGLLMVSILGGFLFTALILMLQNQDTLIAKVDANLPRTIFGVTASDIYFPFVYIALGGLSFICVLVGVAFTIVASAKNPTSVERLFAFGWKALVGVCGGFGALLTWIIIPYNMTDAEAVLIFNLVVWFIISRLWRKDERKDREARRTTKK